MQQLEINQTELGDLQQKEVAADDDGEDKKKKFKLPQIEIPDRVKIFLLVLLKQVSEPPCKTLFTIPRFSFLYLL